IPISCLMTMKSPISVTTSPASITLFGFMRASSRCPEGPTVTGRKSRPPRRVLPARARQHYTPHRPRRIEWPLEPDEGRDLVSKDPRLGVRGHAPEQRGEELVPASEPGLEHVVDRALREVADQHVVLARRDQLHPDQARSGCERRHVDGLAGSLGQVLRGYEDQAVVHVRGKVERAIEYLLASVFAGRGFHAVFPGGPLERHLAVLGKCRPALDEVIASHGKDPLLSEHYRFVEQGAVFEAEQHAALDFPAPRDP